MECWWKPSIWLWDFRRSLLLDGTCFARWRCTSRCRAAPSFIRDARFVFLPSCQPVFASWFILAALHPDLYRTSPLIQPFSRCHRLVNWAFPGVSSWHVTLTVTGVCGVPGGCLWRDEREKEIRILKFKPFVYLICPHLRTRKHKTFWLFVCFFEYRFWQCWQLNNFIWESSLI